MDENFLERAEEITEANLRARIALAGVRRTEPAGFDGHCNCGDEIPAERVALRYYRCITCQQKLEAKNRWT